MIESESIRPKNALLISPNLGHPLFLNIDSKINNKEFEVKLLFVSNLDSSVQFEEFIKDNIYLIPILEYKWKLLEYLKTAKKKRLLKLEKGKKRSIWSRLKSIFVRDKKEKIKEEIPIVGELIDSKGDKFDIIQSEKIKKLRPRAFRGDVINPIVLKVEVASFYEIDNPRYDNYYNPQNYLNKHEIFGSLNRYYIATIYFKLTNEITKFLENFNFLMFDIVFKRPNKKEWINYHSIVVSKNEWINFKFFHATDLHLAERNDRIYEIVKKWKKMVRKSDTSEIIAQSAKALSFFQRLLMRKPAEKAKTIPPLHKRYINPNNNFRNFIKLVNKQVIQNNLDFIVLTGDLIDFSVLSKIDKEKRKNMDFDYEYSNWRIFKEIILNQPQEKRRGMVSGEELLCPIFTVPGNHDFRPYHYDLRWGNLYKKIGLTGDEAIALNDELLANPISSITKSFRSLKAYLREINSSLDYYLKLGENNFIFLNSGSDSFKNIIDFVSGHPSVTGLTNKQIKYLENIANNEIKPGNNTFLLIHGPPINPKKTIGSFKRFSLLRTQQDILTTIDQFKESFLAKLGKKGSSARIDDKFDLKYGTISSNWAKLLKFCLDFCILTLSGHTHQLKEFRLKPTQNTTENTLKTPPYRIEKLENPAEIFYDLYSEQHETQKEVELNAPYILQTPALGLGSYFKPNLAGTFREIIVEKGKLTSFKVEYIKP
ncbi:MAG: metallophosphoesterase [Candidatus Lokiarchaeota archaeon]|nr:metallophosphoesterase [Candidatus Lokiarchaeota archaeon]